jgi:hypothetical protein
MPNPKGLRIIFSSFDFNTSKERIFLRFARLSKIVWVFFQKLVADFECCPEFRSALNRGQCDFVELLNPD